MNKLLTTGKISPFVAGVLMALLFMITAYILDDCAGAITAYSKITDKIVDLYNGNTPSISWEELFLIGVLLGSFVAALVTKQFKLQLFPEDHLSKGPAYYLTTGLFINFLGGFLVMCGLIIAGDSFLKMWNDALGLFIIVGLFLIIMFIESVVIGTMLSVKIEEK